MGYILNISSSSINCSVSVAQEESCISLVEEHINNHDEKIHTFIKYALEGAKINLFELHAICVDKGPGSYTGIRIGSTVAKGLCYALNIPILAVDSLSIMIQKLSFIKNKDSIIIPLIDAKSEVYTAIFDSYHNKITPITKMILNQYSFQKYDKKKIYIIGNGINQAKDLLKINFEALSVYYPSAENMIELSNKLLKDKKFENINSFEPFY